MMHYEIVIETTCCGRQRPISKTIETPWSLGGVIYTSYRCVDDPMCEARELDEVRDAGRPFYERLAN